MTSRSLTGLALRILLLTAALEPLLMPQLADAALPRHHLDIPAGTLEEALLGLARQTGISLGLPNDLPIRQVPALKGDLPLMEAFGRLLQGSDLIAVPVGATAWRIERQAHIVPRRSPASPDPQPVTVEPLPGTLPEIVVTAAKRSEPLAATPIDHAVISSEMLERQTGLAGSAMVADYDNSLAFSNIGPGRNRPFLRGVGDSPFNGQTQSTVAVLLDDARITFNAPDPDLRLVDIDRIELLKGPQGPLYGTGALGGVYRLVPARPDMSHVAAHISNSGEVLANGGVGGSGSAMINLPLMTDQLAIRAVIYGAKEPGWIDNDRLGGKNSNHTDVTGGRLALRWAPSENWTVDLAGTTQMLRVADSQYVVSSRARARTGILREPHDNDFANVRMSINGRLGNADFISATSWTTHEVDSRLDATTSSALFGLDGPTLFRDKRKYRVFNQEFRLSGEGNNWRWMTGLSVLQSSSALNAKLQSTGNSDTLVGTLDEEAREWALFGDIGYDLSSVWTLEAGARLFATTIRDEKVSLNDPRRLKSTRRGISPSASLAFKPGPGQYYYLRFASAFRPRGLSPFAPVPQAQYASDELNAIELGGRWHQTDRRLEGQAVLYASQWTDIQSDYLLPNGLVATRNSGKGQIYGISLSGKWRFAADWRLAGSADWQHARLEKPASGTAVTNDLQLPVVPSYKASVMLSRDFQFGPWKAEAATHLMLMGPTHLSLNPAMDRRVGAHEALDLSLSARRGQWRISLSVQNLFDSRADSFAYGNPFSFASTSQHVTLRPRAIGIGLGWNFTADRD